MCWEFIELNLKTAFSTMMPYTPAWLGVISLFLRGGLLEVFPAATESAALAAACNSAQPSPGSTGTLVGARTTLLCALPKA